MSDGRSSVRPSSIPARSGPESRRRRLRHGSAPSATWLPPRAECNCHQPLPRAVIARSRLREVSHKRTRIRSPYRRSWERRDAAARAVRARAGHISYLRVGRSIIGRITDGTGPPGSSTTGRCTRQCNVDAKAARAACGAKVKTSNTRVSCRRDARTTREACRAGCPPKEEAPVGFHQTSRVPSVTWVPSYCQLMRPIEPAASRVIRIHPIWRKPVETQPARISSTGSGQA